MSRRVLITGISGFVGGYLAKELINQGNEVYGIIRRRSDSHKPKLLKELGVYDDIKFIHSDITELSNMLTAIHNSNPDWIFHLAAQSFVPRSFEDPLGTFQTNCLGTQNLLEAVRLKNSESKIIFAGSSEEYGLQFIDETHWQKMGQKYGEKSIEPTPRSYPELPINEQNILRPMSPYATSKVFGDYATRNYHTTYGLNSVVSRAFNHEGAGRGHDFVTSSIVRQLCSIHLNEQEYMDIGDVTSFRDWSHVEDIINGYILLAEKAKPGSVYVQGSNRTLSVLSYILYTISLLGYDINEISNFRENKIIKDPLEQSTLDIGQSMLSCSKVDKNLFDKEMSIDVEDEGIFVKTDKRKFKIKFITSRFRPSDVPILLSDTSKIQNLGFKPQKQVSHIINDQINYYLDPLHRRDVIEAK